VSKPRTANGGASRQKARVSAPVGLRPWQVLDRKVLLRVEPWLEVVSETVCVSDGRVVEGYLQVRQRDYVVIVALDARRRIMGLWRYKHGPRRVNLGLPAGYLEEGETALTAANRELREEAGLVARRWRLLGAFTVDGNRSQSRCHIAVAFGCRRIDRATSDDLEEAKEVWLTRRAWQEALLTGSVATMGAAIALMLAVQTSFGRVSVRLRRPSKSKHL
jgi:8-oxo-dGTP pyrophosphatase MutT (NUDIX family)